MRRVAAVLLAAVLLAGAGPRRSLPLPPPLPADPPVDEAAPVPNNGLHSPSGAEKDQVAFALRTYPMQDFATSDAFIPGSAYQSPEQRKMLQTPGFMVTLPLP